MTSSTRQPRGSGSRRRVRPAPTGQSYPAPRPSRQPMPRQSYRPATAKRASEKPRRRARKPHTIDMTTMCATLLLLLIVRGVAAYAAVKKENRALRAERDRLLLAEREREHTRLARRAAHRAQQEEPTQHEEEPQ